MGVARIHEPEGGAGLRRTPSVNDGMRGTGLGLVEEIDLSAVEMVIGADHL